MLDGAESKLEGGIDELMNDSYAEFVYEKEDSEKDDVSDYQPKIILIPEVNIHVIEDRGGGGIQKTVRKRVKKTELMSLKQKYKPKGQSKEKEKGKGNEKEKGIEKVKKVEVPWNWQKNASPHPKRKCNLSEEVTLAFPGNHTPFNVFSVVTNLDPLLKLLVDQSNLYV